MVASALSSKVACGIEGGKVPLYRVLGEEIGRVIKRIHADHGIEMIFDVHVSAFEEPGSVERAVTQRITKPTAISQLWG